MKDSDVKPKRR